MIKKKKYLLLFSLLLFSSLISFAWFTSIDSNNLNYIQIGKIPKHIPNSTRPPEEQLKTVLYDFSNVTSYKGIVYSDWLLDVAMDKGYYILNRQYGKYNDIINVKEIGHVKATDKLLFQINTASMFKSYRDTFYIWKSKIEIINNGKIVHSIPLTNRAHFDAIHLQHYGWNDPLQYQLPTNISDCSLISFFLDIPLQNLKGDVTFKTILDHKEYDSFTVKFK